MPTTALTEPVKIPAIEPAGSLDKEDGVAAEVPGMLTSGYLMPGSRLVLMNPLFLSLLELPSSTANHYLSIGSAAGS